MSIRSAVTYGVVISYTLATLPDVKAVQVLLSIGAPVTW
jgi:hypothetical protein